MRRNTWIILGLIIILGSVYFFTTDSQISVGVKELTLKKYDAEAIDRIDIVGEQKILLAKHDGSWRIKIGEGEGVREKPVDIFQVEKFFNALNNLRHLHYVTKLKDKYEDLGLDQDSLTSVKLYGGETLLWAVDVGRTATGGARFVKIPSSDDVHAFAGTFRDILTDNADYWREKSIVSVKDEQLSQFVMKKGGSDFISLVKNQENNQWQFSDGQKLLPPNFRADRVALKNLVGSALSLRASGFLDQEKRLGAPKLEISLKAADADVELQFFAGDDNQVFVKKKTNAQIFIIPEYSFKRLNKNLGDLRDLTMLKFDKRNITKFAINGDKGSLKLVKSNSKWEITDPKNLPEDFKFDPQGVEDILNVLARLSADRVAVKGRDLPRAQDWQKKYLVELTDSNGQVARLFAGKSRNGKDDVLLKGNIDDEIYVVNASRLSALNGDMGSVKKEDFDLPPIDENTKGFDSLPPDIKRKLLNATKKTGS